MNTRRRRLLSFAIAIELSRQQYPSMHAQRFPAIDLDFSLPIEVIASTNWQSAINNRQ